MIYVRTVGKFFVHSHTSFLTLQNDLAVLGYSTRKTCTDTCNVKRLGRVGSSNKQFLNVELAEMFRRNLQVSMKTPC